VTTDRHIEAYRAESEARFDEVRAQRVLARLREARRVPAPGRRRVLVPLAAIAAAAALWLAGRFAAPEPAGAWVLADGSRVSLAEGARVAVERASETHVRLLHDRGRASYDVSRRAGRLFEVITPRATVRVRGTAFDVEASDEATEVRVREGRVEVDDGARQVLLGAGESLRVAPRAPEEPGPSAPTASAEAPPAPAFSPSVEPEVEQGPPPPPSVRPPRPADREALLGRADDARRSGDLDAAARWYAEAEALGTPEERAEVARLSARIESRRGRHARAARAYERCLAGAPEGPHAEDALAGAALAWSDAGDAARARGFAADYVARWPTGLHRAAMNRLLER
jgi:hypothetical protein